MWNLFNIFFPKKIIGIDIGTSSIKVVELSRRSGGWTLENYGQLQSSFISKEPLPASNVKSTGLLSTSFVSTAIRGILDEAKIRTKAVVFSIPDFSTFCTSFDIPVMPEKEIPDAIRYNASQYITLPISEVTLDWQIVSRPQALSNTLLKVFLVAVPNQVIQEYQNIAAEAGLQMYALEAEALGIARVLAKRTDTKPLCIVDIGVQSSTVNIIDNGLLTRSYGFNFHSGQLSRAVSTALNMPADKAEEVKNQEGMLSKRPGVSEALRLLLEPLVNEIKSVCNEFFQSEQKQVEKIILTGGTANLPGLKEYLSESLKKEVSVPNCFTGFLYPPILEDTLRQMSPSFSVAVGVALGGFEA